MKARAQTDTSNSGGDQKLAAGHRWQFVHGDMKIIEPDKRKPFGKERFRTTVPKADWSADIPVRPLRDHQRDADKNVRAPIHQVGR